MNQLPLFAAGSPPPVPAGLPPAVQEILHVARSVSFQTRIVRGRWGVGIAPRGRKWIFTDDCCCALGALLVVKGVEAEKGDHSAIPSVARLLGIEQQDVVQFISGFDGLRPTGGEPWFGYGKLVAQELVVSK
jgi:hypothetical protein